MNTSKFFNHNETTETSANFTGHQFDEFTGSEFDNFDNDEFKNNEFEKPEFANGEFAEAEDEFNNNEFSGDEFVEDGFNNSEFGEQKSKFERKNNMSDNFGSKFAALILTVLSITLSASSYQAATINYDQYHGYKHDMAAEQHHEANSYQDRANYGVDYIADGKGNNYNAVKSANYYAYERYYGAKYSTDDYKYNAYKYAHTYQDYNLEYIATDYEHNSKNDALIYENARYGDYAYEQHYV